MNEFNLDDNSEIGTSISKLKNNRMKKNDNYELYNLIKDLENRLEAIELSKCDSIQLDTEPEPTKQKYKITKNNKKINYINIIIFMIIFLLLNDKKTIEIIYNIPFINNKDSPYPNLIFRTLIFGLLFFIYDKFVK